MGLIIRGESQTLWEPTQAVGRLFLDQVRAVEKATGLWSGVGAVEADEVEIAAEPFRVFVLRLADLLSATNSGPLFTLCSGCFQVSVFLYLRLFETCPPVPAGVYPLMEAAEAAMQARFRPRLPGTGHAKPAGGRREPARVEGGS